MIPRDIKRATPIYQVLVYDIIIWKVSKILIFVYEIPYALPTNKTSWIQTYHLLLRDKLVEYSCRLCC